MSASLPWYAELLGKRRGSAGLDRLIREYALVEASSGSTKFLENEQRGLSVIFDGKEVAGIHHLSDEVEGCARFAGPLPLDLDFAYTRDDVARALGPCDHDTGPRSGSVWRYDRGTCWVAVAFSSRSGRVETVTLESPASVAKILRELAAATRNGQAD